MMPVDACVEGRNAREFNVLHQKKIVLKAIEEGVNRRLFCPQQWGIIYWLSHHSGTDIDRCRSRVGGEAE